MPPRFSWSDDATKTLLEACLHEVSINDREGVGLKPKSWAVVAEKLKNDHGVVVDFGQMKYRYDYLKAKYAMYVKLKNKTENIYNPKTNKFNLTEEEWKAEEMMNKNIVKLKNPALLFPDLCTQLFEGATATGSQSYGISSKLPRPSVVLNDHDFEDMEMENLAPPAPQIETLAPDRGISSSTEQPVASEESSGQSKNKGKRKRRVNTLDDDLREVGKEIVKAAQSFVEKNNIDKDMDKSMAKLDNLDWGELDPRYQTALMLFGENPSNLKVWLRLRLSTCDTWVRNAGKKFGLFESP